MSERVSIPETGVVRVGGEAVTAANITTRAPFDRPDGAVAPTAQLHVGESATFEVQAGDRVQLGDAAFVVADVVEDPEHHRGEVVLEPAR